MKRTVFNIDGTEDRSIELPPVFNVPRRPDLIKRAVLAEHTLEFQPQGRSLTAGRMGSYEGWGPGRGASRVARTKGSQTHHASRGAFINMARGGKLAHPPRAAKIIVERINKKEHRLAIMSALSYTTDVEVAANRGHRIPEDTELPLIVSDQMTEFTKTKQVIETLVSIGLEEEMDKIAQGKSIRAGKGKMRGRKYRRKLGPLLVTEKDTPLYMAARNVQGLTVLSVEELKAKHLAPGTHPGRLTVFTESSMLRLEEHFK